MKTSLTAAVDLILSHEGGYVEDPRDPGGCTNLGITLATYRAFIHPRGSCSDLKHLTANQAASIYQRHYWDAVRGDDLPAGLDVCVVDMAVNAGVSMAAKLLQRLLGVPADGVIGAVTLAALDGHDVVGLCHRYSVARIAFYQSLPTFKTFGKGWSNRVITTQAAALLLANHHGD